MPNWTQEEIDARNRELGIAEPVLSLDVPPKRNKYGARKKEVDGHVFASSREAARYIELKAMQAAGAISVLELQPRYTLQEAMTWMGKRIRKMEYVADFAYRIPGKGVAVVEDVKGVQTPVFNLKAKLFRARYPHLRLEIVK